MEYIAQVRDFSVIFRHLKVLIEIKKDKKDKIYEKNRIYKIEVERNEPFMH